MFERRAIEEWLKHKSVNPVTRQPLKTSELKPNHKLQRQIATLKEEILAAAVSYENDISGTGSESKEHNAGTTTDRIITSATSTETAPTATVSQRRSRSRSSRRRARTASSNSSHTDSAPIRPHHNTVRNLTAQLMLSTDHSGANGTSLPIGTQVERGRDWQWGSQDGGGNGKIVTGSTSNGWVRVKWESTRREDSYRWGADGKYDLKVLALPTQ